MKIVVWGTRGSLPTPGPETVGYGGNTPCIEVRVTDDHLVVLDAGTGIRRLGATVGPETKRIDILLTHLHMDHIVGLGFFEPFFTPGLEVHVWGPATAPLDLGTRLARYLSPPLFPVRIRDLRCELTLHTVPFGDLDVPNLRVRADLVCHPGLTVGYRIEHEHGVVTYLPDHEPALGVEPFPQHPGWTSGYTLAAGADLLIHDAQYDDEQYRARLGWGHSTVQHALAFAALARVRHLVAFHHDPTHDDDALDRLWCDAQRDETRPFALTVAAEGATFVLPEAAA